MLFSSVRRLLTLSSNRLLAASRDGSSHRAALFERLINAHISRRDALRLSVSATIAAPLWGPIARAASQFEINTQQIGRVLITIGGVTAFEVRTDQFDGAKVALHTQDNGSEGFSIRLTDGLIPGTTISGDFELSAVHTTLGWQARFVWQALGFDASFAFEHWLLGFPVAGSPIHLQPVLTELNVASSSPLAAHAVFLPNWTFKINLAADLRIDLPPGTVATSRLQLELIPRSERALLLKNSIARTRLWVSGQLLSISPIKLNNCQASFVTGQVDSVLETHCGAETAWAMESAAKIGDAGHIIPHVIPGAHMAGFGASQLRVVNISSDEQHVEATLNTTSKWYSERGIHIEVTAVSTTFYADVQTEQAKVTEFLVTRMVVPLAGVDQAIFVRMPAALRVGQDKPPSQVDQLNWFDGIHLFGRTVPLDDFELHLARGSDALQVVVRFHNVSLKASGSSRTLIGKTNALIEYAFGSQHVSEEALYVSDLLTRSSASPAAGDDQYISDIEICKLLNLNAPDARSCEVQLDEARKKFFYDERRRAAIQVRATQKNDALIEVARARFADATWLTFSWSLAKDEKERHMAFSLKTLFDWSSSAHAAQSGLSGLTLVQHPLALGGNPSMEVQRKRRNESTRAPKSLRETVTGDLCEYATLIQAPYRLGLSPIGDHHWRSPAQIDDTPGLKELWTVRTERIPLRAIWSADYNPAFWPNLYSHYPQPDQSFRAPLDARDRHEIVALSSRFGEPAKLGSAQVVPFEFPAGDVPDLSTRNDVGIYVPKPIQAQLLQLSAYGASLRLKANWAPPSRYDDKGALTVQFWDQNSQLGRDTRVVVEYKGFLFPLGQPATLVKETVRRLVCDNNGSFFARLVQRFYIKVPSFTRALPALQQPFEGRGWPFASISTRDFITPDLQAPELSPFYEAPETCTQDKKCNPLGQQAFWPRIAGSLWDVDFPFEDALTGVKARAPLLFIDNEVAHHCGALKLITQAYRSQIETLYNPVLNNPDYGLRAGENRDNPRRYIARVDSGAIRFAPETQPGTTRYKASCFLLDVDVPGSVDVPALSDFPNAKIPPCDKNDLLQSALVFSPSMEAQNQPPFYPHLRQALVNAGPIAMLSGTGPRESRVEIDGHYLRKGFDAGNSGEIYLRFVDNRTKLEFSSNTANSGGFANTSTVIAALSRKLGPIGGAGELKPQLVGYRYEVPSPPNTKPLAGFGAVAPASQGSDSNGDPVSSARKGGADPREFFGQALGEAKLCGVVAFADIIDGVTQAVGARAPRILQEFEHALPIELLTPLAQTLRKAIRPLIDTLNGDPSNSPCAPRLHAAILKLDALLTEVSGASGTRLLVLVSEIANASKTLRDEVNTAIEDPTTLLPSEAFKVLKGLLALRAALQAFFTPTGFKTLTENLLNELKVTIGNKTLATLEEALSNDVRYTALLQQARSTRDSLQAIERAAQESAQALLKALPRELIRLLEGFNVLNGWSLWIDDNSNEVQLLLHSFAQKTLEAGQALGFLSTTAARLKVAADLLKSELTRAATTDPAIDQVVLEVSEITLAAISHADAVTHALNVYDSTKDPLKKANIFANYLRTNQEVLSKVSRVFELSQRIKGFNDITNVLEGFQIAYADWVHDILQKAVLPALENLGKQLASGSAELETALKWMRRRLAPALALVKTLNTQKFDDLVTQIGMADSLYALNAVLIAATNPSQAIKTALNEAQNVLRTSLLSPLQKACDSLKTVLDELRKLIAAIAINDPTLSQWVAPALLSRIDPLRTDLEKLLAATTEDEQKVEDFFKGLDNIRNQLVGLFEDVSRIATSGDLGGLVNIRAALDEALEKIGIPTTARLRYDWETEVNPYPAGAGPVFEPQGNRRLEIHSLTEMDLRGATTPKFSIEAKLDSFAINLFGATPFLSIVFKPLTFVAGSGREANLSVNIDRVDFKGALTFVKKLQEYLKETFGLIIEPRTDGPGVVVGYSFNKDVVTSGVFQLQNVGFNISCILPFDSEPARFRFGLSRPDKPFLLSAGIYGGGGHVAIQSRADTLESLDASFEYGLVTAFKFGPAVGTGRITAGIYIRLSAREATLSGFFNASGVATIAGLVTVSAEFRVQIWYDIVSGRAAGAATFSVSFSIGFLDYEYKVGVAYAAQGDKPDKDKNGSGASTSDTKSQPPVSAQSVPMADMHALAGHLAVAVAVDVDVDVYLAAKKTAIAQSIEPSPREARTDCLLEPQLWQQYWTAFEDYTDGCN